MGALVVEIREGCPYKSRTVFTKKTRMFDLAIERFVQSG